MTLVTREVELPLTETPWAAAAVVVRRLREAGHQAVFVGGCVRDLLLGRAVKDIDVASDASPEAVEALFEQTVAVGKQFGVIIVVTPEGQHVEVAAFRSDEAYVDGRRPTGIRAATEAEDVWRRDFTINALVADSAGIIRDHVGGLADLDNRVIRVVGGADRLVEDRLRVMRGLRFAAQLACTIEPATWEAIRTTEMVGLSRERIWEEWDKILSQPQRAHWWQLLVDAGHASVLGPTDPTEQVADRLQALPADCHCDLAVAATLMNTPETEAWLKREPISRDRRRRLVTLLSWRDPAHWAVQPLALRRRVLRFAEGRELLILWQATAPQWAGHTDAAAELAREQGRELANWLSADDLMAMGFPRSKALGDALRALEDAELEERITDRVSAEMLAKSLLSQQQ